MFLFSLGFLLRVLQSYILPVVYLEYWADILGLVNGDSWTGEYTEHSLSANPCIDYLHSRKGIMATRPLSPGLPVHLGKMIAFSG